MAESKGNEAIVVLADTPYYESCLLYTSKEIFHKLREREYNPELMRLYVVGGGGCMVQNFGEYDKSRVAIVRDICATAKGYEAMTVRKIQRNGGMLV